MASPTLARYTLLLFWIYNTDVTCCVFYYYFSVFLESKVLPNKAFGHFAPKIIYNLSLL